MAVASSATRDSQGDAVIVRLFLLSRGSGRLEAALLSAAAALMLASGLIHLYLWHLAYRHVATLGPLFLVQAVAALLLAASLPTARRGFLLLAALALMAGTIVGFILVTTVGLFGFTLTTVTGWAVAALATEVGAIITLTAVAAHLWRDHRPAASPPATVARADH
jgi:hypothetical protein